MSEYMDGYDDGKGEKFDELIVEIVALREQLKKAQNDASNLLWKRDEARTALAATERDRARQVELMGYANAAIDAERERAEKAEAKNAALREQLAALHQDASSKWAFLEWRDRAEKAEAKIDALMFEYCPIEMSLEQIARWKKHQVVRGEGK